MPTIMDIYKVRDVNYKHNILLTSKLVQSLIRDKENIPKVEKVLSELENINKIVIVVYSKISDLPLDEMAKFIGDDIVNMFSPQISLIEGETTKFCVNAAITDMFMFLIELDFLRFLSIPQRNATRTTLEALMYALKEFYGLEEGN